MSYSNQRGGITGSVRWWPRVVVCALLIGLSVLVQAASLNEVRGAFNSLRNERNNLDDAVVIVEDYHKNNRESVLALAYLGSVRTIQGARSSIPWKKMSLLSEGFGLLDRAVALLASTSPELPYPVVLEVLMVSGLTNAAVPKIFKRRGIAQKNLEDLIILPGFDQFDNPKTKAIIYAWLAVLASEAQDQNAITYLNQARRLNQHIADDIWNKR